MYREREGEISYTCLDLLLLMCVFFQAPLLFGGRTVSDRTPASHLSSGVCTFIYDYPRFCPNPTPV